uniref:Uncharacterized protein n=1 Tax=Cyprinus carpio TaxID=7962 RepID=A0A8C2AZV4_CYPCA
CYTRELCEQPASFAMTFCILPSLTQTLASCISKTPSTAERKEFIFDFIKTFIEADIPLEKTSKLPAILQKYCKQGGSVTMGILDKSCAIPGRKY